MAKFYSFHMNSFIKDNFFKLIIGISILILSLGVFIYLINLSNGEPPKVPQPGSSNVRAQKECESSFKVRLEKEIKDIEDQLKREGDELKEMNGKEYYDPKQDTPEFYAWHKYYADNRVITQLYEPKMIGAGYGYISVLKDKGVVSQDLYNYFLNPDNKELIWGLNPAIVNRKRLLDRSNSVRDEFNILKHDKNFIIDKNKQKEIEDELVKKLKILEYDIDINKASPFVVFIKNGKKYILDCAAFWQKNVEENQLVTFFTPDYKTMMNALMDPEKKLVPFNYVPTANDINSKITLVRVKELPITQFLKFNEE
jgi:hypothetical protein